MRSLKTMVLAVVALLGGSLPAHAQTNLVAGGLTNLPPARLSPNLALNGGFESHSGSLPASWSGGGAWAVDQLVRHSGTFSYRWGTGAPSATQSVRVKKGVYNFSAWVRTQLGASGGLRLQLDLRPAIGSWWTTDPINGTRDWTLYQLKNLVVPQDTTVTLKLENYSGPSGTAWFDDVKLEQVLPEPVNVYMLYPNFRGMLFDDQSQTMKFDVTVTHPSGGDPALLMVTARVKEEATGRVVSTRTFPGAAHFVATLDGFGLTPGVAYLVEFSVNTSPAYTYPAYRVSKVPAAARQSMNIAYDEKNRVLIKGRPRFVLGVYDSGGGYGSTDAFWEQQIWSPSGPRRLDGLRINFYMNYWMGAAPADAMNALMSNLQKRGVMYLQNGNCFDKYPAGTDLLIHGSDSYVRAIGSHAGNGGYYTADECRPDQMNGVFEQYKRLRALDPDSMTFAALFGHPDLAMWREAADMLSTDPYPLYSAEPAGGYDHKRVADWTALTRDVVKNARPFMTVLQFFRATSLGRWPTRAEMRGHAYMAIVEGARGLWWWSVGNGLGALNTTSTCPTAGSWCAFQQARMADLKAVVSELADLEPVLLADDAPGALRGNSNPSAIRTKVKLAGGRGYVFAYNYTNSTQTATFTWNTAPGTVSVNAENRSLSASGSSFTDSFGPYQAHVYVIGSGGSGSGGGTPVPPASTAPSVSFSNPASGATVGGTTTVSMAASGGTTPYTFRLAVDGATVYTGTNNAFSWNTATTANGGHTLTATVTDGAGRSATASRAVTVSNSSTTPPTTPPASPGTLDLAMTAPKPGTTVSGTGWAVLWLGGTTSTSNTYTLSVGGVEVARTATSSRGPVSLAWDTRRVPNGTQTLLASARDSAGKTGTASVSINVANAGGTSSPTPGGPAATFTAPAAGATLSGTASVTVSASGGTAPYTYTLTVDGAAIAGSGPTFSWNTTGAANGGHTLAVTVRDAAGRTATATRAVTVSNTAGTLSVFVTAPREGAVVSGTGWVVVWLEGTTSTSNSYTLIANGVEVARLNTASRGPVSMAWDTRRVANGVRTLQVTARDSAGRTGAETVSVTVRN